MKKNRFPHPIKRRVVVKKKVYERNTRRTGKVPHKRGPGPTDPFHPKTMGFKLPAPYLGVTTTVHSHGFMSMTSTASNFGCGLLFRANPYCSVINTGLFSGVINPAVSTLGLSPVGGSNNFYGVTTPGLMQAKLESFRVTSWGIKIKLLTPPLARTGRIVIASLPDVNPTVGYNAMTVYGVGSTTSGANSLCAGISPALAASNGIMNYPLVKVIDCANTNQSEFLFTGLPVSNDSATFRNSETGIDFQTGNTEGVMVQVGTTVTTTGDRFDSLTAIGWNAFVIFAEGFPPSQPMFEVEYIYHFEGVPSVGTVGSLAFDSQGLQNRSHRGWQEYLDSCATDAMNFATQIGSTTENIMGALNNGDAMLRTLTVALSRLGVKAQQNRRQITYR